MNRCLRRYAWLVFGVLAAGFLVSCGRKKEETAPAASQPKSRVKTAKPEARTEFYGVLKEAGGDVKVAGKPATVGMKIRQGDRIVVAKGYAVLATAPRGDLVRIFSDTVTEFLALGASSRLRLDEGKVWVTVKKLGQREEFHVETVNAVAGVRGTDFLVERKGPVTRVGVAEGQVAVRDLDGNEVTLKANEQTRVVEDRPPEPPSRFNGKFEMSLWESIVQFFRKVLGG